jgi:ketosteroid isomerase-like protein
MRVDDVTIDVLGNTAMAFCRFRFVGEVEGRPEPFVASGRATFVCRRTGDTWKVVHYHESAPS